MIQGITLTEEIEIIVEERSQVLKQQKNIKDTAAKINNFKKSLKNGTQVKFPPIDSDILNSIPSEKQHLASELLKEIQNLNAHYNGINKSKAKITHYQDQIVLEKKKITNGYIAVAIITLIGVCAIGYLISNAL